MREVYPLKPLPKKVAIVVAAGSVLLVLGILLLEPMLAAEILSSVINLKVGMLLLVGAFLLRFFNSIVLAASISFGFTVYAFVVMQGFWDAIGYEPNFFSMWLKTALGSLIILSPIEAWLAHGARKENTTP